MNEQIQFFKSRKVKSPVRANPNDAGADFFVPEDLTPADVAKPGADFLFETDDDSRYVQKIIIAPRQSVLIPTGIHVRLPKNHVLIYFNKSGVASKKHLLVGAQVIDEGYTGECHINLHNVGNTTITLEPGDKIAQAILLPVVYAAFEEKASKEELYEDFETGRGDGGFGSTGTK